MAITKIDQTLVAENVVTAIKSRLAPLSSMTVKYSPEYKQSMTIPVITGVASTQTNAANYTTNAAATAAPKVIALDEKSLTVELTKEAELGGWDLVKFVKALATQFGNDLCKDILAKLPAPGTKTVPVVANYVGKDLIKLNTVEADEVYALLEKTYFNQIMPTDKNGFELLSTGAYGYQGIASIVSSQLPSTVVNAIYGKGAIGVAFARCPIHDGENVQVINIGSPEIGDLEVVVKTWISDDTGKQYMCMKVMMGAIVLDNDLVATYKSATA